MHPYSTLSLLSLTPASIPTAKVLPCCAISHPWRGQEKEGMGGPILKRHLMRSSSCTTKGGKKSRAACRVHRLVQVQTNLPSLAGPPRMLVRAVAMASRIKRRVSRYSNPRRAQAGCMCVCVRTSRGWRPTGRERGSGKWRRGCDRGEREKSMILLHLEDRSLPCLRLHEATVATGRARKRASVRLLTVFFYPFPACLLPFHPIAREYL